MHKAITLNNADNLGVALTDLLKGEQIEVNGNHLTIQEDIKAKHKFALKDFMQGDTMYMYGLVVGTASQEIKKGVAIKVENTKHEASAYDPEKKLEYHWQTPDISHFKNRTFNGYHRPDGQVGTHNVWLVFPLVFCENRNILALKNAFEKILQPKEADPLEQLVADLAEAHHTHQSLDNIALRDTKSLSRKPVFENVQIKFITHQAGCGGTRQDSEILCRLLAGYLKNPNVAGATVLSLGCQNAQLSDLKKAITQLDSEFNKPLLTFDQQSIGNVSTMLSHAIKETYKALVEANNFQRKPAPLSKLTIGLECGGSDGFSGISANPALGHVSDMMAALGGKVILSEFPELCGVEQELMSRTKNTAHISKFIGLMRDYAESAKAVGSGFDMNPSPGNIKDGLITDAMKSAGAAKKGGSSPVNDVLDYTEYVKADGLSLLCTPGNDVESTTGLAGSGANIILFTTGLGTPTGNPAVPVIKVSSNTTIAEKMPDIIDVNAGSIIEGKKTIAQLGEEILEYVIKVASGELQTKADALQQDDFIPWKRGVSL